MRYLLSGLAAFLLLGAVMSTPAEARCWWNGWTTVCGPRYWGYGGYYRPWWVIIGTGATAAVTGSPVSHLTAARPCAAMRRAVRRTRLGRR